MQGPTRVPSLPVPAFRCGAQSEWTGFLVTPMHLTIRRANRRDQADVEDVLAEAVRWLEDKGEPLWGEDEVNAGRIEQEIREGSYYLAQEADRTVAVFKFELADPEFWPDVPPGESTFIHRLAVRRSHAGGAVSTAILRWSLARTIALGRKYLRLDCVSSRPKLRRIYESFGFRWHSDRQVGPWHVSRYEIKIERPPQESWN